MKRGMALVVMLALLFGMLPFGVVAQEEGCAACRQHNTAQVIRLNEGSLIGKQLLSNGVNIAEEFPNNPPAHVDTASEKAQWIADVCRSKGITDPWEIALWLHDWLIYNANYDYTYSRYTADGVLLDGTGVCDSYTRAYNLLLQQFGIESMRLSSGAMDHAWNLVKIDGQWCHIDVTWDDPNEGGCENHFYFGLTDAMMKEDHEWSGSYPACTSDINYYPIRMGYAYTNKQEMHDMLDNYAKQHVESMELFYLGNDPDFEFYDCFNSWYQKAYYEYDITNCWVIMNARGMVVMVTYPDSVMDDHVHSFKPVVTQPPTCTQEGYTISVCSKCSENLLDNYVDALGHTGGTATCVDQAVCTRCGKAYGDLAAHDWPAGGCGTNGACSVCGLAVPSSNHVYDHQYDYKCNVCGETRNVDMTRPMVDMYRMYNPNTGEHFYTGSTVERDNLIGHGWHYEGIGFTFPLTTGKPVHRLFQPSTGEHLYTMDEAEKAKLMAEGWNYEGIAFNSGFENEVPQYRLHNPNTNVGAYHFTASEVEKNNLIAAGWEYQGIGWYSLGA